MTTSTALELHRLGRARAARRSADRRLQTHLHHCDRGVACSTCCALAEAARLPRCVVCREADCDQRQAVADHQLQLCRRPRGRVYHLPGGCLTALLPGALELLLTDPVVGADRFATGRDEAGLMRCVRLCVHCARQLRRRAA